MKTEKKFFKKFIAFRLMLLTIIIFILSSCEKEEPNPPIQPMYGVPTDESKAKENKYFFEKQGVSHEKNFIE